jgi:hypothetical protein
MQGEKMNPVDPDIEHKWIEISKIRLHELKSGKVKGVSGDEVFNKILDRFEVWSDEKERGNA